MLSYPSSKLELKANGKMQADCGTCSASGDHSVSHARDTLLSLKTNSSSIESSLSCELTEFLIEELFPLKSVEACCFSSSFSFASNDPIVASKELIFSLSVAVFACSDSFVASEELIFSLSVAVFGCSDLIVASRQLIFSLSAASFACSDSFIASTELIFCLSVEVSACSDSFVASKELDF